jgi:hypothetical protein
MFLWAVCAVFPPLGLNPSLYDAYKVAADLARGTFSCLDGSGVIAYSDVNDNFVDCPDGSDEPGTGAVANSTFYCGGSDAPREVRGWSVGDGICDCCDGSDEFFNPRVRCPDRCPGGETARAALLRELAALHRRHAHRAGDARAAARKGLAPGPGRRLPSQLAKLHREWRKVEQNRALDVAFPRRRVVRGFFAQVILDLWEFAFDAPRWDGTRPVTQREARLEGIAGRIAAIEAQLPVRWNASIDTKFFGLFRKIYTFQGYKLSFLQEIWDERGSLARFADAAGDTHVYVGAEWSVEVRLICGESDRWLTMAIGNTGRAFEALFATPVACSREGADALEKLSLPELKELALGLGE